MVSKSNQGVVQTAGLGPPFSLRSAVALLEEADAQQMGAPLQSAELAERALEIARAEGDSASEVWALVLLGWGKLFEGMPHMALALHKQAMELGIRSGDCCVQARVLSLGGLIQGHFSRFGAALSSFDHALQLVDEAAQPKLTARILNNLGTIEVRLGHCTEAEDLFRRALEIRQRVDDPIGRAVVMNNLACAILERGRTSGSTEVLEAAHTTILEAVQVVRAGGAARALVSTLLTLADVQQAMGRPSDSRASAEEALTLARATKDRWMHAFALSILGEVCILEKAPERACSLLRDALEMFAAQSVSAQVSRINLILSTALEQQGDFKSAIACMRRHLEMEGEFKSEDVRVQSRFIAERLKFERLLDDAVRYQKQLAELESLNRDLAKQQADLESAAFTDVLTGLPNRRRLDVVLDQRVERERGALAVCVADIDDFKRINDDHGHDVGDRVLSSIAALFKANIRATDLVGRIGGEEFVFVLACSCPDEAGTLLERIRAEIEAHDWSGIVAPGLRVTISAGYVFVNKGDATMVLKEADQMLYRAKRHGKNRVLPAVSA